MFSALEGSPAEEPTDGRTFSILFLFLLSYFFRFFSNGESRWIRTIDPFIKSSKNLNDDNNVQQRAMNCQ